MKTISKRELVRNPSALSHLQPGDSLAVLERDGKLIVSRPKGRRLTAEQIEADLQRLSSADPKLDVQSILRDLRS